ncbi:MAG TPA: BTAD domain-containing putative transcriptional regulator [Candidatus Dormibacteraeota bacterium]|nr:BTAD domain-containing putative transcriptional regulator [Candidatus Dormibacteraeota bacterium]
MNIGILGPLEVATSSGPVVLGGPKQRALLGLLALDPGRVVSTDRLITALWGEDAPPTALNLIQGHVGDLRRLLGPDALLTRPPGYLLQVGDDEVDALRFERLVAEARELLRPDPAAAAARLRAALALWRGPVLDGAGYRTAEGGITRLEELRLVAIEDRVDADLALGHHAGVVPELRAALTEHPGRERLCARLMLALYRAGRQEEALQTYRTLCDRLREELGIDPCVELQRLERSILRQEPSLLLAAPVDDEPVAVAVAVAPSSDIAVPAAPPEAARPGQRVPILAAAAVLLVGASSVGVLRSRDATSVPPCAQGTPAPAPQRLGPGLGAVAVIAHSCDQNSVGVWPRSGPARDSRRVPPSLGEGTPIRVTCQDRHGALVIDNRLGAPPQPSSTVWDRLDDGTWVSDVYTSLPKHSGEVPPLGLAVC